MASITLFGHDEKKFLSETNNVNRVLWVNELPKKYRRRANSFIAKLLRRVYISRLRMRLLHCVAFFINYLGLLISMDKKIYYFENATQCKKCMRKPDVATRLKVFDFVIRSFDNSQTRKRENSQEKKSVNKKEQKIRVRVRVT